MQNLSNRTDCMQTPEGQEFCDFPDCECKGRCFYNNYQILLEYFFNKFKHPLIINYLDTPSFKAF